MKRYNKWSWLKVLNSPFKPFKLKIYIGRIALGVPYFFPRKWVKATPELAMKATIEHIERQKNYNKMNPQHARVIKPYEEIYNENLKCRFAIPLKFGFDSCGLGWKTKWEYDDFRFEWSPVFSFVFFKWQIALTVYQNNASQYWESWLYYELCTDGTKEERIKQCIDKFPQIWTTYSNGDEKTVNYYNEILKKKYLKLIL